MVFYEIKNNNGKFRQLLAFIQLYMIQVVYGEYDNINYKF